MNKGDLAAAVAEKTDLSKAAANQAVEAVFAIISDSLRAGELYFNVHSDANKGGEVRGQLQP